MQSPPRQMSPPPPSKAAWSAIMLYGEEGSRSLKVPRWPSDVASTQTFSHTGPQRSHSESRCVYHIIPLQECS